MNKNIRLLVEGFFDDEIFNVGNDIKTDLEDLGKYYDYQVGDIYYLNKKPYAICCGESKYFNDNNLRFCLLDESDKQLKLKTDSKLVIELLYFKFEKFNLKTFNDFLHIDEKGYKNTLIIKNNYDISEFPAFEYCLNLGDNVYLPAIDELLIMYLNKDKLGKYSFIYDYMYWSSTLYFVTKYLLSIFTSCVICIDNGWITNLYKSAKCRVRPFFHLD